MNSSQYDVVIVGAGCAGLTAAIGLDRAGLTVAVVEATEGTRGGMLGGVCSDENLLQPDILGADGEALAWERRLIARGSFVTDGQRIAGSIYRDAEAFRPCHTVLRSRFTQNLAEKAQRYGIVLWKETTVESLIREGRRIIGVATTRGPLYAKLVFLAEGDCGLLVTREGLDRSSDPHDQPAFLYCLQQLLELPPGVIEECFRLRSDQGVAYDFLLRNPARMPLNARGFLCTNRQGLTLSLVLPAKHLQRGFLGQPRQLLDWFVDMPALRPWLRHGQRGLWTATLLRTGGLRDMPYLVEDGLVIGGAAAGLGVDFPFLNLMDPATATGVQLSRAAARIRAEGRGFDRDALVHHYLGPLQQSRYWRDMEFIQRWPGHLARTHVLFESGLDLLLDSASVWARARRWLPGKLFAWLRVLARVSWSQWNELRDEFIQLGRVLRLRKVTPRPALTRLLLDGALNAFRDLVRRPRPHVSPQGTLRLYYHAAAEEGRASAVPWLFRRWFERFRPVLAVAGSIFYANDDKTLSVKLTRTIELLLRQINLIDCLAVAALGFPIVMTSTAMNACRFLSRFLFRRSETEEEVHGASLDGCRDPQGNEEPAARGTIATNSPPQIHILWRETQPEQNAASVRDLSHICPIRVFEIVSTPPETVRVDVHAERCISCHACWRLNPLVDWGRNGTFLPSAPELANPRQAGEKNALLSGEAIRNSVTPLLDQLEFKLRAYDLALTDGPTLVDRAHNHYLEILASYAQQLANRIREVLKSDSDIPEERRRATLELADALVARAEERTRRVWEGRFAWAGALGRLLRQHYLVGLRRLLDLPSPAERGKELSPGSRIGWAPSVPVPHSEDAAFKHLLADVACRHYVLEAIEQTALEKGEPIQAELLAVLVADVRHVLSARTAELQAFLDDNTTSDPRSNCFVFEEMYRRQGKRLFDDLQETLTLLDVPGDWPRIAQLRILEAEREELAESERRLIALAIDWHETSPSSADDELKVRFARQAAHILAGKLLLLRTFARLEQDDDAELAILLLRVWLDYSATLLDEYTILVREQLRPISRPGDRPLVEPDSGAPLRTQAEYLATPATYRSGDFLLAPLDLLRPRLVPEMVGEKEIAVADSSSAALLRWLEDIKGRQNPRSSMPRLLYLAEALTVESIGRVAADPSAPFDLECACTRVILAHLCHADGALRVRCAILRELTSVVIPHLLSGITDARARHLERDVLELEALKADFLRRLTAVWQVFGESLRRSADVQASCFALAEAAAWLKAADSTLGRMAWLSRLCQAEDREEPAVQQELGRRGLAHCLAEIRDRHFRFDEDLASLRRGYYAPHIYAATLLPQRGVNQSGES